MLPFFPLKSIESSAIVSLIVELLNMYSSIDSKNYGLSLKNILCYYVFFRSYVLLALWVSVLKANALGARLDGDNGEARLRK